MDAGPIGPDRIDRVFSALGDPGRRSLVMAVAARGSATATELAAELPVTRQAVAKQLLALADAGLLRARRAGRETRYEVTPEPLGDAVAWMVAVGGRRNQHAVARPIISTSITGTSTFTLGQRQPEVGAPGSSGIAPPKRVRRGRRTVARTLP